MRWLLKIDQKDREKAYSGIAQNFLHESGLRTMLKGFELSIIR